MACDTSILKEIDKTYYQVYLLEKQEQKNNALLNTLESKVFKSSILQVNQFSERKFIDSMGESAVLIINHNDIDTSLEEIYAWTKKTFKQFKLIIYNIAEIPIGLKHAIKVNPNEVSSKFIQTLNVLKKEAVETSGDNLMKAFVVGVILVTITTLFLVDIHPKYAAGFLFGLVILGFSKRIFKIIFFLLGMKKAQAYCECL